MLVQLSLSFGAECQPAGVFRFDLLRFFWPLFLGLRLGRPLPPNWSRRGAAQLPQLPTANCQVPSAVPNCGNIFGDEARSDAQNKRLKTRTGRDGWLNQQLAAPFGATSGGFSTWLAGHTFPLHQLPATRCRPSSWGITQRRSTQRNSTPLS